MKQELKPCPFCGEQPMVSEKTLSVYCKNALCPQIIADESDNLTDAIQGWNTRPEHSGESAEIDWEQRRYEIAKTMLPAMNHATIREDIKASIKYANELINQLKQQSDE